MKYLAIIITTLSGLTLAASAETDPKKVAAILEGAKVCNATADPVACMTGFMAALGVGTSEETSGKETIDVGNDYSVRSFNDRMLCSLATQTEDGKKYWIINSTHSSYVAEARRRNLVCGINNKIKTSKTIEPIKEQFEKESNLLRKRTQYALLSYGYYKGSVDGVWGINTRNALLAYITKEKLTGWEPIRVFDYLRKDIGWSSAQDTSTNSTELKANSSVGDEFQHFKNWTTVSFSNGDGGLAFTKNDDGVPYIGISCFQKSRNIIFVNPDFKDFSGKPSMISKVKKAAKSPIIVFNDDFDKQYKIKLSEKLDNGKPSRFNEYHLVLGSTLSLPNGEILKNLGALNEMKSFLMSKDSIWVGYSNPKTNEIEGRKYSLSGSTEAIRNVYKMGKCD